MSVEAREVNIEEKEYPVLLPEISDPPAVLYLKGKRIDPKEKMIAVVGTRRVTSYGVYVTEHIVLGLVEKGWTIVSGFMYGVDAVAHKTAIRLGARTIGVLGFGFNHMYPKEHVELAEELLKAGGTLVTEYPPSYPIRKENFPRRNRIVAGMCRGVVVTEAAAKSGSKITARLAAEYGREVFAVPGPIDSPYSEGTKELVNLGAKLVTSAEDICEDLVE